MGIEEPKEYTPEEIAQLEKSRTISDAELLNGGAEYAVGKESQKEIAQDKDGVSTIGLLRKAFEGEPFGTVENLEDFQGKIRNADIGLIGRIVHVANKELYLTFVDREFNPDLRLWNAIPSISKSGHPDRDKNIGLAQFKEGLSSVQLRQLIGELNAEEVNIQGDTILYVIHG